MRSPFPIQPLSPLPNSVFARPEELLAMSGGKVMMRLRQSAAAQSLLAIWDPASSVLANLTSAAPALFQNGLGAMARTGDHTKIIAAANDTSGELAIFDAYGAATVGPHGLGAGTLPLVAANLDGSRFAVQFVGAGASQLILLDAVLNQIAPPVSFSALGLAFSRDGSFLYASENVAGLPLIAIFDGRTMRPIGQVPDASIQGVHSEIEEADETQLLFAISNRGVSFIDAANPTALPSSVPSFASAPAVQPSQGPFTGTPAFGAGQNFEASARLRFGPWLAPLPTVSPTQIQFTAPPSVTNGALNLTAYFPSGWLAIAPDAFSYGPQILEILPNAASKAGGDPIQIYGYGFGSDPAQVAVKIGGAAATIQALEDLSSIAPSLSLDSTYPFPLQRVTLLAPSGTPGQADITIACPAGVTTSPRAFQYMQSAQVFAKPALYKFIYYDQKRQWLYLSATDHIDVFDLAATQFHATPLTPPGGPPPNVALRGLALTPDASQLAVADFGAQSVYLLSPDAIAGTTIPVGGVAGFLNSGPARVAATSVQTVFVAMSGEGGGASTVCSSCLSQLNLSAIPPTAQPAPQPQVTGVTGTPLVQADATGDQIFLAYNAATGGPIGLWSATAPNQFTIALAKESAIDLATASDGTVFTSRTITATEIRNANLTLFAAPASPELEQIPNRVLVPGAALHPSGALLYQPFLTGPAPAAPPATGIQGGIDIIDAHTGLLRLRVFLPEPLAALSTDIDALHGSFLALDENGQRIFALTTSGLTVIQLATVPLSIGTVSPTSAPASGGTILTIRGSGFQSGATVTIAKKSAPTAFVDTNTLSVTMPPLASGPQQILITNPNGDTYALDAAFTAN